MKREHVGRELALDRTILLERFDGDVDLLRDIADAFLAHCPLLMNEVHDAVTARDAARLKHAAHSLKGSVANFGVRGAVDAAFRLERMGAAGGLDGADAAWAELEATVHSLELELNQLVHDTAG